MKQEGSNEAKKKKSLFSPLVTCRAPLLRQLKMRDPHGVEFYMQTPSVLPSLHTTAPWDPRLPGCAITDPEGAQPAGIRSSLVTSAGRARAHQETHSFSPDKGKPAQCSHLKPIRMSQASFPRNSCKLKGVLVSRRVGDLRVHLEVAKNFLWSIQVNDSEIYPEGRGYKRAMKKFQEGN